MNSSLPNLVYDIREAATGNFTHWLYIGGAVLAVAGIMFWWSRQHGSGSGLAIIIAVAGLVAGIFGYGANTWDHWRLANHLQNGDVSIAEGVVSEHQVWRQDITNQPGITQRRFKTWETVVVGGVRFTWGPGAEEAAFTNRGDPPLAVADGLPMRVTYVEDVAGEAHQRRIVRLEIGMAASGSPPSTVVTGTGEFRADPPKNGAPFPSSASPVN